MTPVVSVRNVSKRLGTHNAVDAVSLDVAPREAIAVLGPSGSGKTTLLRLIAGLEIPDRGEIWLNGAQASTAGRLLLAPHQRGVGFVFQDLALWPHLTVEQQLDFVLGSNRVARASRAHAIHDTLRLVHLDALATRYPHQLSGGEQQRVALARALVSRPALLLMDEPLSSLDPDLRAQLRGELARVTEAAGMTLIYVTHHPDDAEALADRVIEMRAGRLGCA